MIMVKINVLRWSIMLISILLIGGCRDKPFKPSIDGMRLKTIQFGMIPYGDHTNAIIGIRKGWFKEVGIDINYTVLKVEGVVPALKNKTHEVVSTSPGIIMSSYDSAPNLYMIAFGDLFQGYALMSQPEGNYKNYQSFLNDGLSEALAMKATIKQLEGKTFAYPAEAAVKPFIDLILKKGEIDLNSINTKVVDDPTAVNLMRSNKADFQVGGAPSRITLEKEGFIPLISSIDLVRTAKPSAESDELSSVFPDGWAVHRDFYKKEFKTVMRLASVNYRIARFIKNNQDEALAIHMPFLSEVTGEKFDIADGKVIYNSLDPFYSFEDQKDWYHNPNSPLYYIHVNGSVINNFEENNIYENEAPDVEDIIFADDVYYKLEEYKLKAEAAFMQIEEQDLLSKKPELNKIIEKAKHFFSIYNFLDAYELANEVLSKNN